MYVWRKNRPKGWGGGCLEEGVQPVTQMVQVVA